MACPASSLAVSLGRLSKTRTSEPAHRGAGPEENSWDSRRAEGGGQHFAVSQGGHNAHCARNTRCATRIRCPIFHPSRDGSTSGPGAPGLGERGTANQASSEVQVSATNGGPEVVARSSAKAPRFDGGPSWLLAHGVIRTSTDVSNVHRAAQIFGARKPWREISPHNCMQRPKTARLRRRTRRAQSQSNQPQLLA